MFQQVDSSLSLDCVKVAKLDFSLQEPRMQKREREDENDILTLPNKRQNVGIFFTYPEMYPDSSGVDSDHSYQGWETELCRDTPDTSSSTDGSQQGDSSTCEISDVEYELDSHSEAEKPFDDTSETSSDDNDLCVKVTETVVKVDEEEFWGDDSHSDGQSTTSDLEISKSDLWTCLRCKCINKPIPRYCSKCFQVRKNWFPSRPSWKHKKRKLRKRSHALAKEFTDSGLGPSSKSDWETTSEGVVLPASTCDQKHKPNSENTRVPLGSSNGDACIGCMEKPRNTAFVHGSVGHICCCYKCAKKMWSKSGRCPVCNQKSNRVIKVFYA